MTIHESQNQTATPDTVPYQGDIPRQPLRFVWYVARQYWGWGLAAFSAVTVATLSLALVPYFFGIVIDSANAGDTNSVFNWIIIFLLVSALGFAGWRTSGFAGLQFLIQVERFGHIKLFEYLQRHSQNYFNNRFAGSLANKVSNGADGAEHMLESLLWNYYGIFLNLVITVIYFSFVDWRFAVGFVGAVVLIITLNIILVQRLIPLVISYADASSKFRGGLVDSLTNIAAVKSYAREGYEHTHIGELATERMEASNKEWSFSEWILVLNNTIVIGIQSALFLASAYFWSTGAITAGTLVMLITVLYRVQGDLVFIGNNIRSFIRHYGTIEEGLNEILVGQELTDTTEAQQLKISGGTFELQNVTFNYEKQPVFTNFSLTIPSGQRVGIVGSSGAGKTTLVSLLLRQYNIDSGSIMIDGQDISQVTQQSLRSHIALVPQEPLLFHRSIEENIAYGNAIATKEEVIQAAQRAEAHEFIMALPEGYNTLVGERGVKLSGGQKQRVAIARAFIKNAPILILDEATSALDSESEVAIQQALEALMEGRTVIAIAHRLSTLRKMDRIIVLENGQIVEDGTHETLARAGGVYQRLWEHQAGGFLTE